MKRLLAILTSGLTLAVMIPAIASAAPTPPRADISGVVTDNGSPVAGATVTVTCGGKVKTTTTTSVGAYAVIYGQTKNCPTGSTATVTATKGSTSGTSTGKVNPATTKLNVAIVNVSLPELGLLTGAGAAVIGGGAFLVMRRRQLGAK